MTEISSMIKAAEAVGANHIGEYPPGSCTPMKSTVGTLHAVEDLKRIAKLETDVEQLQKELTLSTDQNDLLLDEFVRVKCLTDNLEIHALCERAHLRMRQRVSVIDRNFKQAEKIRGLESQINDLLELIYNSAEGEICMGYKADIENMAQVAHAITGINASQVRRREVK